VQKFFENLFSLKKELLVECFQRIFFVVTKIDIQYMFSFLHSLTSLLSPILKSFIGKYMHSDRAPPLEDIPKTVVTLLRKLCPEESRDHIAISEKQVLMINAKEALLARQVAGPNPSEDVQKAYSKVVFGKKCMYLPSPLYKEHHCETLSTISFP
jgi:hypothetical protein